MAIRTRRKCPSENTAAYVQGPERLLGDAMNGALFTREDAVEAAWVPGNRRVDREDGTP
jgi:glucose-6-phosphate 1-dehydrogenase